MDRHIITNNLTTNTKITGIYNHWSLIPVNINGLSSSIKRHRLTEWMHKQNPSFCYIQGRSGKEDTYINTLGKIYKKNVIGNLK